MHLPPSIPLSTILFLLPNSLFSSSSSPFCEAKQPGNSILLSTVKSLTLYDGRKTSHRRVSAIPQLQCIGGSAQGLHTIDVMRCQNSGSEYGSEDIQWTCQASLPPEFKLGSTDVICEGYDSPDDPRVLKGSCGVQYRLILTRLGEEVYGSRRGNFFHHHGANGESSPIFTFLFWLAFIGILAWMVYRAFVPAANVAGPRIFGNNGWFGGGGGGGGGGGWNHDRYDGPPPPYTPRAPKTSRSSYHSSNQQTGQSWRPGFWTGAATGAAAGYMAGNRRQANSQWDYAGTQQQRSSNWYGSNTGSSSRTGGSSGGSSSSTYESSGFGGTSRR